MRETENAHGDQVTTQIRSGAWARLPLAGGSPSGVFFSRPDLLCARRKLAGLGKLGASTGSARADVQRSRFASSEFLDRRPPEVR